MFPTRSELKRQIGMLRYQRGMNRMKVKEGCCDCATLFRNSMIDMLLIPLYYAWVRLEYGSLSDIRCESYLLESYTQFENNARTILQEQISMLREARVEMQAQRNLVLIDSLLKTYNKIQKII